MISIESLLHGVPQPHHQLPDVLALLHPHAPHHALHLLGHATYQGSVLLTENVKIISEYFNISKLFHLILLF